EHPPIERLIATKQIVVPHQWTVVDDRWREAQHIVDINVVVMHPKGEKVAVRGDEIRIVLEEGDFSFDGMGQDDVVIRDQDYERRVDVNSSSSQLVSHPELRIEVPIFRDIGAGRANV